MDEAYKTSVYSFPSNQTDDLFQVHINDGFAKFSESLFIADRHAREEVRQRALMQQRLAQKEKASKEEHLRSLAQRAREERAAPPQPSVDSRATMSGALAGYGSDDDSAASSGSEREEREVRRPRSDDEAEEAAKVRDDMRKEKRYEREREMRMSNMGQEQRAKQLARQVFSYVGISC
jgi:SNW domain-containing protein 1